MPRRLRVIALVLLGLAILWALLVGGPVSTLYRITPGCSLELRSWARLAAVLLSVEPRPAPSPFNEPRAVACQRRKGGSGVSPFAPVAVMTAWPDTRR